MRLACSECSALLLPRRGAGRPRVVCSSKCGITRRHRRAREVVAEQGVEVARWWLGLSEEQRLAAMAHVKVNPPPKYWLGGRHAWAYFSRAAFSCEGRVTSEVG